MAFTRGITFHQYVEDWLIRVQSQRQALLHIKTIVNITGSYGGSCTKSQSLHQLRCFVGNEYHLDSALVKPTQDRGQKLQDMIFKLKLKYDLTPRCLMSLIGLLVLAAKMLPDLFSSTSRRTGNFLSHSTASFLGQRPYQLI